jgi:CRISPR system Cascade subunit CasD
MKSIGLHLEGVLQAWGVDDAAQRRRTRNQPHQRAILGLIRAAKGLERHETWDALETLKFSCEIRKPGLRMWDFATMRKIISADGSHVQEQGIQEKEYLVDAAFTVTLSGEDELVDEVIEALENPVFLLGLGRRDCMPSVPILVNEGQQESRENKV